MGRSTAGTTTPRNNEFIGALRQLKRRENNDAALELLQKLAAHVRPIMKTRKMRVGAVEEFYPTNPNLLGLNVNRGHTIRIRLRDARSDTKFLDFHDLIGTMLHELTHNVHGPHDDKFYKLLDELWVEYQVMIGSGGFHPDGTRLGGGKISNTSNDGRRVRIVGLNDLQTVTTTPPTHAALPPREDRAAAADRRRKLDAIMLPAGGRALGTATPLERRLAPARMAALAAERRARDRIWCGSGDGAIVLDDDDDDDDDGGPGPSGSNNTARNNAGPSNIASPVKPSNLSSQLTAKTSTTPPPQRSATQQEIIDLTTEDDVQNNQATDTITVTVLSTKRTNQPNIIDEEDANNCSREWTCATCTLINRPLALQCECCFSLRPSHLNKSL